MMYLLRTLAMAAVIAAPAAAAPRPSQLIIFGDSLTDAGNINASVGGDFFNPVAAGYFPGRFTNGPDYTDIINDHLYGSLTTPSLLGGSNYSFGSARYVNHGDPVPDLALQLGFHFAATGGVADPDALYIINLGGNDVFGLQSGSIGPFASSAAYVTALLDTVQGSLLALSNAGASRILVTGIPNTTATGFAVEAQLQARLNSVEPLLGSTELLRFSYQNFFIALASNPKSFGVAPFTQSGNCIGNRPVVAGVIDCTGYFSFDGIHPTAQVHRALSREIAAAAGIAVPEPASWAMLIAGFGLVGAAQRRRRALVI
jgi:phospholipase/lecithinase/hemolysin